MSYDEIEIKPNSIIYCDIPYKNTDTYNKIDFDYERFYVWCKKQKELVFISSYEMPDDFISVAEFEHRSILSSTAHNKVLEKVFIPKHQLELYQSKIRKKCEQLELFDLHNRKLGEIKRKFPLSQKFNKDIDDIRKSF